MLKKQAQDLLAEIKKNPQVARDILAANPELAALVPTPFDFMEKLTKLIEKLETTETDQKSSFPDEASTPRFVDNDEFPTPDDGDDTCPSAAPFERRQSALSPEQTLVDLLVQNLRADPDIRQSDKVSSA